MGGCIDHLRSFPFFQVWKFIKAWMTTKFRRCRLSHLKGRLDWSSFLCAISWQIYNEKHKVSWGLCLAAPAHSLCLWQLRHHPTHVHHRIFVEVQRLACLSGLFLDQALDRIHFFNEGEGPSSNAPPVRRYNRLISPYDGIQFFVWIGV